MTKRTGRPVRQEKQKRRARPRSWHWVILALTILLVVAVRMRMLDLPLERDEGEYAYAGQLMLQGIPPYALVYNMKLPGTYAAYAVILLLFGQSPAGVHFGLLVVNVATVLMIYFLGKRLLGRTAGVVAGSSFALLSVSMSVQGLAAHATHFVALCATAGLLLLLKGIESGRLWQFLCSGVLLGLAFLMKQPGIVFAAFGGLFLCVTYAPTRRYNRRPLIVNGGAYAIGAILPIGLTCLALYLLGVFGKFWFWTVSYAREYVSQIGLGEGLRNMAATSPRVMGPSTLVWILAGVGLSAFLWDRGARERAPFVLGLFAVSFLGICPGLYFRPQYYILMLPVVALLAGTAVSALRQFSLRRSRESSWTIVPMLSFVCALSIAVVLQAEVFFETAPVELCRQVYGANPFPESLEIARYLKEHTRPEARIAVLGSEPEVYFYSRRRSATGYIYMYGLMEKQKYALTMQQQMISEIEQARPEYLVLVNIDASWAVGPDSDPHVLTWSQKYIADHYAPEGVADILDEGHTEYRWGAEAQSYQPRSRSWVCVYRQKAS